MTWNVVALDCLYQTNEKQKTKKPKAKRHRSSSNIHVVIIGRIFLPFSL